MSPLASSGLNNFTNSDPGNNTNNGYCRGSGQSSNFTNSDPGNNTNNADSRGSGLTNNFGLGNTNTGHSLDFGLSNGFSSGPGNNTNTGYSLSSVLSNEFSSGLGTTANTGFSLNSGLGTTGFSLNSGLGNNSNNGSILSSGLGNSFGFNTNNSIGLVNNITPSTPTPGHFVSPAITTSPSLLHPTPSPFAPATPWSLSPSTPSNPSSFNSTPKLLRGQSFHLSYESSGSGDDDEDGSPNRIESEDDCAGDYSSDFGGASFGTTSEFTPTPYTPSTSSFLTSQQGFSLPSSSLSATLSSGTNAMDNLFTPLPSSSSAIEKLFNLKNSEAPLFSFKSAESVVASEEAAKKAKEEEEREKERENGRQKKKQQQQQQQQQGQQQKGQQQMLTAYPTTTELSLEPSPFPTLTTPISQSSVLISPPTPQLLDPSPAMSSLDSSSAYEQLSQFLSQNQMQSQDISDFAFKDHTVVPLAPSNNFLSMISPPSVQFPVSYTPMMTEDDLQGKNSITFSVRLMSW
ncbi:hypothetical protein M1146_07720 [Patescibacteria group bacterium]|nr:hypothetical protein [Patescibacteria group bacterium]